MLDKEMNNLTISIQEKYGIKSIKILVLILVATGSFNVFASKMYGGNICQLDESTSYYVGKEVKKKCKKGEILKIHEELMYKFCDFNKQIIEYGNKYVCVYIGRERKKVH
jgi:hypothetical protein